MHTAQRTSSLGPTPEVTPPTPRSLRYLAANPALLPPQVSPVTGSHSPKPQHVNSELWDLISSYLSDDPTEIQRQLVNHLMFTMARSFWSAYNDNVALYNASAFSMRDRLIELWNDTQMYHTEKKCKRLYYFSIEFLLGRALRNSILNLHLNSSYSKALEGLGGALEEIYEAENDPGLGNGGLGRLAACFMDSLASQNYPAWGYGIRYTYGMFKQTIIGGYQVEVPDSWLRVGNPWEIQRNDIRYPVRFGGTIAQVKDIQGNIKYRWEGGQQVIAVAYDTLIPGYATKNTLNLRLWSSKPCNEFDLDSFNRGDYYGLIEQRQSVENITSVLYPNDSSAQGKMLRLKQQYFFCCASLQDIIRRHLKKHRDLLQFACMVAIQLNDTHPTISIVELMRLLLDEYSYGWEASWAIVIQTFAYTNHTIMPEALESWPVATLSSLLPRHMQIIAEINRRFLLEVSEKWPNDSARRQRMSIITGSHPNEYVRMAHLAIVSSHAVNGVAEIHSKILTEKLFVDFAEMYPEKFQNKTNGVTPRRWMLACNVELVLLINQKLRSLRPRSKSHKSAVEIHLPQDSSQPPSSSASSSPSLVPSDQNDDDEEEEEEEENEQDDIDSQKSDNEEVMFWLKDLSLLSHLKIYADDEDFCRHFFQVKQHNKMEVKKWLQSHCATFGDLDINPNALFDMQIKRIHEYKRQLLNILGVIHRYLDLKDKSEVESELAQVVPRVVFFAGKAAPAYHIAKLIIKLIHSVAEVVNHDPVIKNLLKVIFVTNYNVSVAEKLIPASDISQHISTAGTEASGTSNMKFALNGGLILGTLDGANVEIRDEIGEENIFIFGAKAHEVDAARKEPQTLDARLYRVLKAIEDGLFGPAELFRPLITPLWSGNDYYLVARDFPSYVDMQQHIDNVFKDQWRWSRMCVYSVAGMGKFSSDRCIQEYARDIWDLKPVPVPSFGNK